MLAVLTWVCMSIRLLRCFSCELLCVGDSFDFIVADVSLAGLVLQLVSSDFHIIALVRPLRVLRYAFMLCF